MSDKTDIDPAVPVSDAQRTRATRAVASSALNAQDCALLLDMLGLTPDRPGEAALTKSHAA